MDLQVLKHLCMPAMKSTWPWCMILLMWSWISFANILFIQSLFHILYKVNSKCVKDVNIRLEAKKNDLRKQRESVFTLSGQRGFFLYDTKWIITSSTTKGMVFYKTKMVLKKKQRMERERRKQNKEKTTYGSQEILKV